ncbi:OsmC family protein [Flavobacterium amniphilum]|uniref:OsmC family protein n=1 Tax=Flavobacterium amniphilum TaxID=1834035 RepID=UPI00202A7D31|nr:OsmC family protein [Flavobacterium amniphilum]MCL9806640.1 OsmC family protein [Flavobacterium amniphilum]
MNISATLKNTFGKNEVIVSTQNNEKTIAIASKDGGFGSAVNGGELLFLSIATCFCNDIYREAAKRNQKNDAVEVTVSGTFGKEGEPAQKITYKVNVESEQLTEEEIEDLIAYVNTIAEIHNTLRKGIAVTLEK